MKRQPSSPERSFFQKGNENITRVLTGGAIALSALALTACSDANAEAPTPAPTNSSSSTPNPEVTPTAKPEYVFTGTVNYDSFIGFAEKDETGKDLVCAEFFNTNLPNGIVVTEHSTGPEIAQWQDEHLAVLTDLNRDSSNPRNQEVAVDLVDCLTSVHSEEADAKTELLDQLLTQTDSSFASLEISRIDPTKVTRYSDGTFQATGQTYGDYAAFTMEGYVKEGTGVIMQGVYEWNGSSTFPAFKLVGDAPYKMGDSLPAGGKAPIVLDSAFANAPWS